jgi:nucleoside-diphosphate-sugar epimerase
MAKVLVTGATGFIGYHLTEALLAHGDEVTCLVRKTSSVAHLDQLGLARLYGDMDDRESLRAAVAGKSVVYHLAGRIKAIHAATMYRIHEQGMRRLAQACAEQDPPPVLILVSSLAAAGPSTVDHLRTENEPLAPVSTYGRSKRAGEVAAQAFADRLPMTVLRPAIVLGEADRLGLALFKSVARFGIHMVPSRKPQRLSVIHAADLARGMILAAERGRRLLPPGGDPAEVHSEGFYFMAGGEHPTYDDLGRMVGEAVGRRRVRVLRVGRPLVWTVTCCAELIGRLRGAALYLNCDKAREITAGSWSCSGQKALEEFGFSVAVPLADRLRQTAAWYHRQRWV